MIEVYFEQNVSITDERRHSKKRLVMQILKWFCLVLGFLLIIMLMSSPVVAEDGTVFWGFVLFFLTTIAFVFISFFLLRNAIAKLNIEFDYFVNAPSFMVVSVLNRSKRRKLISFDLSAISEIGRISLPSLDRHLASRPRIISAVANPDSDDLYYLLTNYNSEKTILYFEPSEGLLAAIRKSVGRDVVLKK